MADLISRQTLAEEIESLTVMVAGKPARWYDAKHSVLQIIAEQAAVDAVEVVRCKDCVRCGFCGEATNLEVMGFYGYCSRGKRREENHLTFASMEDVVNESD